MIREIKSIIRKNFKTLLRSKTSSLVILLGPLVLVLLVGFAFNSYGFYGLKVGVNVEKNDRISESVIKTIQENDFKVNLFEKKEDCVNSVKDGDVHLCIVIIEEGAQKKNVELYVDYSRINLASAVINIFSGKVAQASDEVSLDMATDLLKRFESVGKNLENKRHLLEEMHGNIVTLKGSIYSINNSLNDMNMDVQMDFDSSSFRNELESSRGDVDSLEDMQDKVDSYNEEISDAQDYLQGIEKDLNRNEQEMTNVRNNLSNAYDELGCESREDLFDSMDMDNFVVSSNVSDCSLLYSMIEELDERLIPMRNALSKVESLQDDLEDAEEELNEGEEEFGDMEKRFDSRFDGIENDLDELDSSLELARKQANELKQFKESMGENITTMYKRMDEGIETLEALNKSLVSISKEFNNVSFSSPGSIVKPISSKIKPVIEHRTTFDLLFPSLLLMVITFTGILLSSTLVLQERLSPAYFRNYISTSPNYYFVLGNYLTALFVILLQFFVIFCLSLFFVDFGTLMHLPQILIATVLISSVFILLGMFIGYLFRSEETATLGAISLSSLFLVFSNLLVPTENIESILRYFVMASPFVISEGIYSKLLIFGSGIFKVWPEIGIILLYVILLFGVVTLFDYYKVQKET